MKKTVLFVFMLTLAGCSFSKNSSKEADAQAAQQRSRVDEVMNDSRYSNLQKVEVAIQKGMWDIFSAALPKLSFEELNSMTTGGETLGALAMRLNRLEFLEALLRNGMSPFRSVFTDGKSWKNIDIFRLARRINNHRAVDLIETYRNQYHQEAGRLCATSIPDLILYLEKNYISPLEYVCGRRMDLFEAMVVLKITDQRSISAILNAYLDDGRSDRSMIIRKFFTTSAIHANAEMLTKFDVYCSGGRNCDVEEFDFTFFGYKIEVAELEETAKNLVIIKKSLIYNKQITLKLEKIFFTAIKGYSETDKNNAMEVLETYNLKSDYEKLEKELSLPRAPGDPLPPPPGVGAGIDGANDSRIALPDIAEPCSKIECGPNA